MTDSLLLNIVIFLYAIVAPGIAVARVMLQERDPLVVGTIGLTLGIFGLPVLDFVVAIVFRTHISPLLILSVSTLILLAAGYVWWRQKQTTESK